MNGAISIRRGSDTDLHAMSALIDSAFAIETLLEGPRTSEEELRERMQKGAFPLGHDSDCSLSASVCVEVRGVRGYFGMLAVDPTRQRMGLGRTMVEAAEILPARPM